MTSAGDKEPFELFLQFSRDSGGDKSYVDLPKEPLKYQRHFSGGTVDIAELAWNSPKIVNGLAELRKDPPNADVLAELGDELWAFVRECGAASAIEAASCNDQPIRMTLLSAAAELYALPWELLRINAGPTLAQLDDCTIRYTWTSEAGKTAVDDRVPLPEGGRILFAWSHGVGDEVPWKSHLKEIEKACAKIAADEKTRRGFFDPKKDVLPHASYKALKKKLAQAAEPDENGENRPYRIVHVLCHGGELENSKGLGLLLTSDDETTLGDIDNTSLKKKTLSPDKLMTLFPKRESAPRLVVLSACLGSDAGQPDSRLGSVALATHRAGIESVIASRFLLSKDGSITLCNELYSSLLGGPSSIEAALRAARAELSDSPDHAALQLFQNTIGWDTRPVVFRPYRGLLTFGLEHQRYFFGRDAEIKETVDDLGALMQGSVSRFLIVAAASGTGKSSMVFAGALPQLIKTYHFEWATMRPVADPMTALDAVLKQRADVAKPFLLIVDQFEEVFTHIDSKDKRTEFVRALWNHARGDSGISVIVTLRVDFLGHCKEIVLDDNSGLRLEGVVFDEAHRVFVRQMEKAALREVIEKPAALVGIGFGEGLVDQMLTDAGLEPGALPLLEYTLDQLWEKRERQEDGREVLTAKAYKELGYVTGALAKQADKVLAGFDEAHKRVARRLLVQLVDVRDDAGIDTRKRMQRRDLRLGPDAEEVLATLTSERLLTVGKVEASATKLLDKGASAPEDLVEMDIVEIAHEQLVRSWATLRGWLKEDRQRILACKPFVEWMKKAGEAKTKSESYFLRDGDLALACELRKKYAADLSEEECALVTSSEEEAARVAEEERRRQEELRNALLTVGAHALLAKKQPAWASKVLLEVRTPTQVRGWFEASLEARRKLRLWTTLEGESVHDVRALMVDRRDNLEQRNDGAFVVLESDKGAVLWSAPVEGNVQAEGEVTHEVKVSGEESAEQAQGQENERSSTGPFHEFGSLLWAPKGGGKPKEIASSAKVLDRRLDAKRLLLMVESEGGGAALWNADNPKNISPLRDGSIGEYGGFYNDGRSIWGHDTSIDNDNEGYVVDVISTYNLDGALVETCHPYSSVDHSENYVREGSGLVRIAIDGQHIVAVGSGEPDIDDMNVENIDASDSDDVRRISEGYVWRLDQWTDLLFLGSGDSATFAADSAQVVIMEKNASRTVGINPFGATRAGERQGVSDGGFQSNPVAETRSPDGKRSLAVRQEIILNPESCKVVTRLYIRSEDPNELPLELRGPVMDIPYANKPVVPAPTTVAFSPDGHRVLMVQLGKVWLWPVVTASAMVDHLRSANRSVLPPDKRQEYLGETPAEAQVRYDENMRNRPALGLPFAPAAQPNSDQSAVSASTPTKK